MEQDDLAALTDEELHALRVAVTQETDRRDSLANMPADITGRATFYLRAGGDPALLHSAIDVASADQALG